MFSLVCVSPWVFINMVSKTFPLTAQLELVYLPQHRYSPQNTVMSDLLGYLICYSCLSDF